MQFVYEDMLQESGSYQCRAAHISANGYANEYRYGYGYRHGYGYGYRSLVCIYIRAFWPREDQSINKS